MFWSSCGTKIASCDIEGVYSRVDFIYSNAICPRVMHLTTTRVIHFHFDKTGNLAISDKENIWLLDEQCSLKATLNRLPNSFVTIFF